MGLLDKASTKSGRQAAATVGLLALSQKKKHIPPLLKI